jgi:hypothetical protein
MRYENVPYPAVNAVKCKNRIYIPNTCVRTDGELGRCSVVRRSAARHQEGAYFSSPAREQYFQREWIDVVNNRVLVLSPRDKHTVTSGRFHLRPASANNVV